MYEMAVIGRVCTQMSAYEYSCDDFIFAVVKHQPRFIKDHRLLPAFNNDERRRAFVIKALSDLPLLENLHDKKGKVDVTTIERMMKMVWSHRLNLTHGRLTGSRRRNLAIELHFLKWSKAGDEKGTYKHGLLTYEQPLLEEILDRVSYLRSMLAEAKRLVLGDFG